MSSTIIDRLNGVVDAQAFKAPCRVATTANITLSGLQTIDGVTVAESDRVLVKNQSDNTTNGIYTASSGTWVRALDMDGNNDAMVGTLVHVTSGTANSGYTFFVSAWPTNLGSSALTFSQITLPTVLAASNNLSELANAATARTNLGLDATPESYGAVGDGITNDTTALQNWLSGTKGKAAVASSGKTYLTDPLAISQSNNNVPLFVDFRGSTLKARASSASPLLTIENPHGYVTNFEIRNVTLDANSLHANGLKVHGWQYGSVRNVIAKNATAAGVNITGEPGFGVYYCLFENIFATTNTGNGYDIQSINNAGGYYIASSTFLNCRSVTNTRGWNLDYATAVFVGCEAETNTSCGFAINHSIDLVFLGCYTELNPSGGGDSSYFAVGVGISKGIKIIGGRTIGSLSSDITGLTTNLVHTGDSGGSLIYWSDGLNLSSITKGAADSGGAGFALLRVPN